MIVVEKNGNSVRLRELDQIDNCKSCNKEFAHKTGDRRVYCSKECHYNKDKIECSCLTCGNIILKSKSNHDRNENNYCSRECYNNRRKENLKRLKRDTSYFVTLIEKGCACGIREYYLLHIHHIDGNHKNNEPENLEIVCANCHIRRHLKISKKGKLVYHPKTLTSPDILKLLEYGQS